MHQLKIKTTFIILALSLSFSVLAQPNVTVKIVDKNSEEPIEFVAVRLLAPKDSSMVMGLTSNETGVVKFQKVKQGDYILQASYIGYLTAYKDIKVENKNLDLGNFVLEEDSHVLKDLEVSGTQIQVITRGDTIDYNAAAFQTAENAVVEDLLRKMPGVEITADGKIMVNGEEVKKVRVDGKKFFGDDKEMATKNIPASMIDRVQVLDQRSEMSQLTGFEDGETERIINLTFKSDKRKGVFGNVTAGAGADIDKNFRYDANSFLNIMNGDSRSTITAGANNTNTSRGGFGGFGRGFGGFGGFGMRGITDMQNIGYNISSEINDNLLIGGDVMFNHSDNLSISNSYRENYMQGTTYKNYTNSDNNRENYQSNVRFELEWKPDSVSTIIFQPNLGFNLSRSDNRSDFLYTEESDSTSWGDSRNDSRGLDKNAGLTVIYNKKLAKPGRTFTTRVNASMSDNNSHGHNMSNKFSNEADDVLLDQRNENYSDNYSFGIRASFVEPLGSSKVHFLESTLSFSGNVRNSVRELFDLDQFGDYTIKDQEYSNRFNNKFFRETAELNYRYVQPDYNLTLGMTAEPSQTYSTTIYGDGTEGNMIKSEVFNFAPSARFQYNFARRTFARLHYRGRTNQPSINQMQPVNNNTDLMNETVGNPSLKPAFSHHLRLMFNSFDSETFRAFSFGLNGSATKDNLTNNSIYDKTGKRYVQTINSDKVPFNLNSFVMFNQPFLKKFNFNSSTSLGLNRHYGYTSKNVDLEQIDIENLMVGDLSSTSAYRASEHISLSFNHSIIDVSLRGGVTYSHSMNNFNDKPTETFDWTSALHMGLRPTEKLSFNTDVNFMKQNGYTGFNTSQWIWNASVEYSILKNKGVIAFRAVDILQQRQNVTQSIGDNFMEFSKSNSLPSYYILSFTYKISRFAGMSKKEEEGMQFNPNMFPGGRGGRGGGARMHMMHPMM